MPNESSSISTTSGPENFWLTLLPRTLAASAKAVVRGHMHGAFEGHEFQVPAEFTVRQDGILAFAHYGRHPADNAPVKEILGSLGF